LRSEEAIPKYKIVETSIVTDEVLEQLVNEWGARGWRFEDIGFVVKDSSRRPVMAFLFFTRCGPCTEGAPGRESGS
jgi:hypothetical protein